MVTNSHLLPNKRREFSILSSSLYIPFGLSLPLVECELCPFGPFDIREDELGCLGIPLAIWGAGCGFSFREPSG
ncbi:hypothetical protein Ancab_003716 [Ancistrocladus abbreviatus]